MVRYDFHARLLGLGDSGLNFSYSINVSGEFGLNMHDYYLHPVDFNTESTVGGDFSVNITLSYPGLGSVTSNNFNVKIYGCLEPDGLEIFEKGNSQNLSANNTDYCINNDTLREYYCDLNKILYSDFTCQGGPCEDGRCFINQEPDFRSSRCGDIAWKVNTVYVLDMEDCFSDAEDDSLVFRWKYPSGISSSNTNITVEKKSANGTELKLTPKTNWTGSGYFFIYANDSYNEEGGKVDCKVIEHDSNDTGDGGGEENSTNQTPEDVFEILYPSPYGREVTIFLGDEKTFSIANEDYDAIEWYLNGKLVKTDSKMYRATGLEKGNYTLEVKLIKGDEVVSKTWDLSVEEGAEEGRVRVFSPGKVVFYTIIVVVLIIILLVLILLVSERQSKNKKVNIGFGFVVVGDEKAKKSSHLMQSHSS